MTDLNDTSDDDLDSGESSVNIIKQIAKSEVEKVRTMEWATVKAIYPHKDENDKQIYQCDVDLKNGGNELKNVSILTPHVGLSWIPNIGDQVLIGYVGGNSNSPVVLGSTYDVNNQPPVNDANSIIQKLPQGVQFKQNGNPQKDLVGFEWDVNPVTMKMINLSEDVTSMTITDANKSIKILYVCNPNAATDGALFMESTSEICLGVASDIDSIRKNTESECIIIIGEKDITIESKSKVTINAPQIELNGDSISLKANSTLVLQGKPVNIN
jgi:phage baseplate assembly protein gpV